MSTGRQSRFIVSDVRHNEYHRVSISNYAGDGEHRICDCCDTWKSSWMATVQKGETNLVRELYECPRKSSADFQVPLPNATSTPRRSLLLRDIDLTESVGQRTQQTLTKPFGSDLRTLVTLSSVSMT